MNKLCIILAATAIVAGIGVRSADGAERTYYADILKIDAANPESDIAELEKMGVRVLRHRDNLALAYIPVSLVQSQGKPGRTRTEPDREFRLPRPDNRPAMDMARKFFGADRIATGAALQHPYTGAGVVTGFCDIGFDPMHINFTDADGNCRIRKLVQYVESQGERKEMNTVAEYEAWGTDMKEEFHGTHVAGIMAGSYEACGYQGMAPGSDIVATVSEGSDVGLLAGAEDIIEYARSVGKPAVINISFSSYIGPHDGTSLFCQYIDKLGEEAIICLSAGNEGNDRCSIQMDFTDKEKSVTNYIIANDWVYFTMQGYVDVWSRDNRPFKVRLHAANVRDNNEVYASDWIQGPVEGEPTMTTINVKDNEGLLKGFEPEGVVMVESGINEDNGRYYARIMLDTHSTELWSPTQKWSVWRWRLEVEGEPGVHVDMQTDQYYPGTLFHSAGMAGSTMSISDIATGHNTISVGMHVDRNQVPNYEGGITDRSNDFPIGVSKYSSYGTLIDGRVMPETVAPGSWIISSCSSYYAANALGENGDTSMMSSKTNVNGKDYYWAMNSGTSMASPYVAGTIATWLEANPQLKVADVKEIIAKTNDTKGHDHAANPRNGRGWFKPYEGILAALERTTGIDEVTDDAGNPRIMLAGGMLKAFSSSQDPMQLTVCAMDGTVCKRVLLKGAGCHVVAPDMPAGVYIATLTGGLRPVTLKFAI